jgi:hypothetical protein
MYSNLTNVVSFLLLKVLISLLAVGSAKLPECSPTRLHRKAGGCPATVHLSARLARTPHTCQMYVAQLPVLTAAATSSNV